MEVYKTVPHEFADKFESGEEVKIDTFSAYHKMDTPRQDPMDGKARNVVDHYQIEGVASDHENAALMSMGISQSMCIGGEFTNLVHETELRDMYVFCTSHTPDFKKAEEMNCSLFKISDLTKFASKVRSVKYNQFGNFAVRQVMYEPRTGNPFVDGPRFADPFKKDLDYACENEIRAIWKIKGTRRGPIFRLPAVRRYIERLS
ncbi:MAG: hypothetical protein VX205_13310 [Pseudomonadota bacterium]|nr:hypothetical protein [Pseudomonadota bacterium]